MQDVWFRHKDSLTFHQEDGPRSRVGCAPLRIKSLAFRCTCWILSINSSVSSLGQRRWIIASFLRNWAWSVRCFASSWVRREEMEECFALVVLNRSLPLWPILESSIWNSFPILTTGWPLFFSFLVVCLFKANSCQTLRKQRVFKCDQNKGCEEFKEVASIFQTNRE